MIDLLQMRGVTVNAAKLRASVEGGAIWGDVDRETQKFGLATPGGLISETGPLRFALVPGVILPQPKY